MGIEKFKNIDDWVLYRSKRGKLTFSRQELIVDFSHLSEQTVKRIIIKFKI